MGKSTRTISSTLSFQNVSHTLAGIGDNTEHLRVFQHQNISVQRGAHDLRGLALSPYDADAIEHSAPRHSRAHRAWLSALDAFIPTFADIPEELSGLRRNIAAYKDYILSGDYKPSGDFDRDAYIVALDFMGDPSLERHGITQDRIEVAKVKKFFFSQRLEGQKNLIELVTKDFPDPNAFLHMISQAIGDKPDADELQQMALKMSQDLGKKGTPLPPALRMLLEGTIQEDGYEETFKALQELFNDDPYLVKEAEEEERELAAIQKRIEQNLQKQNKDNLSAKQRYKLNKDRKRWKERLKEHQRELDLIRNEIESRKESAEEFRESIRHFRAAYTESKETTERGSHFHSDSRLSIDELYEKYGRVLSQANKIGRQLSDQLLASGGMRIQRFQTEGHVDGAQLASLVMDPTGRAATKPFNRLVESEDPEKDVAVTLLIDTSTSMKGAKLALSFIAAERLGYWLGVAGAKLEVLSYTSHHFEVHKDLSQIWQPKKSKQLLSGLLKCPQDLTPTAEATMWAHDRLVSSNAKRKILMVMTDGLPDNGKLTDLTNEWIETESPVELVALGIDHHVSNSYKRRLYVSRPSDLVTVLLSQIKAMVDNPKDASIRMQRPALTIAGSRVFDTRSLTQHLRRSP